jgi:hypothetical protein
VLLGLVVVAAGLSVLALRFFTRRQLATTGLLWVGAGVSLMVGEANEVLGGLLFVAVGVAAVAVLVAGLVRHRSSSR